MLNIGPTLKVVTEKVRSFALLSFNEFALLPKFTVKPKFSLNLYPAFSARAPPRPKWSPFDVKSSLFKVEAPKLAPKYKFES